jgi:diguanylate cyclase (GGDEF)-like protein/PAS domain S-box-containing protein
LSGTIDAEAPSEAAENRTDSHPLARAAAGVAGEDPQLAEAILALHAALTASERRGLHVPSAVVRATYELQAVARARSLALRSAHGAIREEVAERVRIEAARRLSEGKFDHAFRSNPCSMAILTLDRARFVEVNEALLACLGRSRDEVVGRTAGELGLWLDDEDPRRLLRVLAAACTIRGHELAYRSASGAVRHALLSAERVSLRGEECILATALDITDRKRAETALRRSEERYALAARGANDGLWDWDLASERIYFSPRWKQMLGHAEAAIGGDMREWFDRVHASDRDRLALEIVAHLEGLTPHFENEHRILHEDGRYLWVLCRGLAVRDEKGEARRFAGSLTDVTERRALADQLVHDALHDAVTGLPNRALFMDRLDRAAARSRRTPSYSVAALVLDLDRFKVVNDGIGPAVGDELVRGIATRIAACVRPQDTVARLGGDEFGLLLEDIEDVSDATSVARRVAEALLPPFAVGAHELVATVSIGIATSATGYESAESLLRDADIALHRAKANGRARYEVFDPTMHERAVAQLRVETDLRRALERGEFTLCYQPIVSTRSGELAGFEALVRWRRPGKGLVLPEEFIPAAEECGLIVPLGDWVLREACRQAHEWRERLGRDVPVSVNLSARQLVEADLEERVARALAETGLPGRLLNLEITESAIVANPEAAAARLGRLRQLDIRISIDDFGKGYSCLSQLHRFPIDVLKVDRSFVSRMSEEGDATVRAIVALARDLGMAVVAEGVETPQQRATLAGLDCAFAQGHLFSEAVSARRAEDLVREA